MSLCNMYSTRFISKIRIMQVMHATPQRAMKSEVCMINITQPLPQFLFFGLHIVHGSGSTTTTTKNEESLGSFIMCITSGGHEVDVGGEGPTPITMHWTTRSSSLPQFWTLVWSKLPVLTHQNLPSSLVHTYLNIGPSPPPTSTSCPLT